MKHMIELYKNKRYKIISERMIEVDNQIVTKQIKKGRIIYTCSCENSGRFGNIQTCRHIKFFIVLPFIEKLNEKIDKLINFYTGVILIDKNKEIAEVMLNDLENLRRLI